MSTTNHPDQPQSRLDREIDEILTQSRERPIPFQDRVAQRRNALRTQQQTTIHTARTTVTGPARRAGGWLLRVPLLTALLVALIAVWLRDDLPILAVVLGLVAVALIFLPFARRRQGDAIEYQKRWRGQVIDPPRASGSIRHWIDAARDRFQR
jgi:Flp pilus assembly protein TadB